MSGYSDGRRVEYAVLHDLVSKGYRVVRAAGSKGFADLVALAPGQVACVNVKRTTMPGPAERRQLLDVCHADGYLLPIVALKPLGEPLSYRLLTGAGPRDWVAWEPAA